MAALMPGKILILRCNIGRVAYLRDAAPPGAASDCRSRQHGRQIKSRGIRRIRGGFRPFDKKNMMRTIAKLAYSGTHGQRSSLSDVIDQVKRAFSVKSYRRGTRPLQDLDDWSDQAEVAYYEDCPSNRCL